MFETAHVGVSGGLSTNAAAVRTLIRDPEAPLAFQALYDHGSPVARIYALTAFWYLRPSEFDALSAKLRKKLGAQKIETLFGCIGGSQSVAALLEPGADAIRFPPGSSAYDVLCTITSSFTGDFAGGFVPISIVEGTSNKRQLCQEKPPRPDYLKPR